MRNMRRYRSYIRTKFKASLVHFGYYSRPRFLIIGAQKSGTNALYKYLSEHPNIIPARKKEINRFDQDNLYNKGEAWYHSHFPLPHTLGKHAITFEATPEYLYYPSSTERIFSYDPHIKLIVLLRDPVERAFSAWNMFRNFRNRYLERRKAFLANWHKYDEVVQNELYKLISGDSYPEFDGAIWDEIDKMLSGNSKPEPSFVRRGLYYEQLLRYFKYFTRDQIFITDSRLLKSNTSSVLSEVIRFLGLPECAWHQKRLSLHLVGKYEKQMPDETRAFLREFYRPYNEKLYELLGHGFGWQ